VATHDKTSSGQWTPTGAAPIAHEVEEVC